MIDFIFCVDIWEDRVMVRPINFAGHEILRFQKSFTTILFHVIASWRLLCTLTSSSNENPTLNPKPSASWFLNLVQLLQLIDISIYNWNLHGSLFFDAAILQVNTIIGHMLGSSSSNRIHSSYDHVVQLVGSKFRTLACCSYCNIVPVLNLLH